MATSTVHAGADLGSRGGTTPPLDLLSNRKD